MSDTPAAETAQAPVTTPAPTEAPAAQATDAGAPVEGAQSPGVPPAAEVKERADAARLASAMRKERELRQRERAIKEAEEKLKRWTELEAKAKADPLEALEAFGHSFETATNKAIEKYAPPKERTPEELAKEAAAAEFKRLQEEHAKLSAEEQRRNQEKAEKQIREDIASSLQKAPPDLEAIAWARNEDMVIDAMTDIFQRDRRIPTVAEAAKAAQEKFVADLAKQFADAPKVIRDALIAQWTPPAPKEPEAKPAQEAPTNPFAAAVKTLTNRTTAETFVPKSDVSATEQDRFARALRILQGNRA